MDRQRSIATPVRTLTGAFACCEPQLRSLNIPAGTDVITVALAGQPNVGKSTVFNLLTGLHQHVGNWPGVTIEKKSGECRHKGWTMKITDLPGTYGLEARSPDERIANEYLVSGEPDVVVQVVDATNLERNLYLTTQLLDMGGSGVLGRSRDKALEGLEISHVQAILLFFGFSAATSSLAGCSPACGCSAPA